MIKVNGEIIKQDHFPDGTLLLNTGDICFDDHIYITWLYENDAELFTVICLAKKAKLNKTLVMPYCPHARQDRIKTDSDTFTLKYFAEVINSLNFNAVFILDPHSNVSSALFNNVISLQPEEEIATALSTIGEDVILFFPDEGSQKRYSDMFDLPYAYGLKKRDWKTGNILGLNVIDNGIDLKDKTILIIDDICSKGGTFYHSAKKLKELGVGKIYLYVTHCENTILEGELLTSGLIENIFTTNSIFTKEHEKICVINI